MTTGERSGNSELLCGPVVIRRRAIAALRLAATALAAALVLAPVSRAQDDDGASSGAKFTAEAAALFNRRCTACHTYGKGIKVGPDLKGVTERRKRDWLLKFIHSSSAVIKSGDPIATGLFAQFKQQRMPDWTDLADKQINDILDYVTVGGPDIKPADERNAELASAAEVENGRRLFTGASPLKRGAQACRMCHTVKGAGWGGTLGPDLTMVYLRYQDRALTEFLRHPCFLWRSGADSAQYLTLRESFSLKAFLRQAAVQGRTTTSGPVGGPDGGRASAAGGGESPLQAREKGSAR